MRLSGHAATIQDIVNALAHEHGAEGFVESRFWIGTLIHQTQALTRDLQTLKPWAGALTKFISATDKGYPADVAADLQKLARDLDLVPAAAALPEQRDRALVQLAALRPRIAQWSPPDLA